MSSKFPLITVLGPTAVGKTAFAAQLALKLDGEIISADSRQVYKGMDIGTGKDLSDYSIDGQAITSHLIDIAEAGTEYSVFQFQRDFQAVKASIISRNKTPILCGGTGLYLESVLLGYKFNEAPTDPVLRKELAEMSDNEMIKKLASLRTLHNTTDVFDRERLIRAIEIEHYKRSSENISPIKTLDKKPVIGIRFQRSEVRRRITQRLEQRLKEGMVEEVQRLLDGGISPERLKMYGLEYKYITMYLNSELGYYQMVALLNTAIHQFAKRQMTWFRRMENKGVRIYWLEGEDGLKVNLDKAQNFLNLPL